MIIKPVPVPCNDTPASPQLPGALNGRLLGRSPLSNLEELEMLRLGVEGKAAGWRTLRALADTDSRLHRDTLDELMARAREQAGLLEELRVQAAAHLIEAEPGTS
jgi:hypothetical protein